VEDRGIKNSLLISDRETGQRTHKVFVNKLGMCLSDSLLDKFRFFALSLIDPGSLILIVVPSMFVGEELHRIPQEGEVGKDLFLNRVCLDTLLHDILLEFLLEG
jgi:hypothetical protein